MDAISKDGTQFYNRLTHPWLRRTKLSGIIARLRLMERIRLPPEDYSEPEMRRLTSALIKEGIRIFVFSFHSPSIKPGGTPYVQSQAELRRFLDKCRYYFDYFFNTPGGNPMTPVEIKRLLNGK